MSITIPEWLLWLLGLGGLGAVLFFAFLGAYMLYCWGR